MSEPATQKSDGTVTYIKRAAMERQIEIMRGDQNAKVWLRGYPDQEGAGAVKFFGSIADALPWIKDQEGAGRAVGIVVGEGGNTNGEITNCNWLYGDFDGGTPLADMNWHVQPDCIVQRDPTHFHAYWRTPGLAPDEFRKAQMRLIAHYKADGIDKSKHSPAGVMRLAGSKHQKDAAHPTRLVLIDNTANVEYFDGNGYTLDYLMTGLPELPPRNDKAESKSKGKPVDAALLREALSYADPSNAYDKGWRDLIAGIGCTNCPEAWQIAHEFAEGKLDRQKRGTPANYNGPGPVDLILSTMKPVKGGVGTGTVQKICADAGWPGTFKPVTPPEKLFEVAIGRMDKKEGAERWDQIIAEVNEHWAAAVHGNRPFYLHFTTDAREGGEKIDFVPPETFTHMFKNKYLPGYTWTDKDGNKQIVKSKPVSKAWPEHPNRREYKDVVFAPGRDLGADILNLYRGWPFNPKAGDWSLLREHMHKIICGGDEGLFKYLMGWSASAVRNLDRPLEVSIILQGIEGCGKGTYANAVRKLFGIHGIAITKSEQMAGRFNAAIADKLVIFADEACTPTNREHVNAIKGLVTEKSHQIERKFRDPEEQPNCIRLIMASNDDWVAALGITDRRFAVFGLAPDKAGDRKYFGAIHRQLENGGYAAMLHDLLHYDLSGFDITKIPDTAARAAQKQLSLQGPDQWFYECLELERIGTQVWDESDLVVDRVALFRTYEQWAIEHRKQPADARTFGKKLRQAFGANLNPEYRPREDGELQGRKYMFLGGLTACRQAFAAHLGTRKMEWPA
jgi:Family of unknown function (DUF5906)